MDSVASLLTQLPFSLNAASLSLKPRSLLQLVSFSLIFCGHENMFKLFQEISSLSVEPCEGETLIVTVFEIHKSEVLFVHIYV